MRRIHIDSIGKTVEVDDNLSDDQIDHLVNTEIIPAFKGKANLVHTPVAESIPTPDEEATENMGKVAGGIADIPAGFSAQYGLDPENPPEAISHPITAIGKGYNLLKRKATEYTTSPSFLEQDIKDIGSGILDYAGKKYDLVRQGRFRHLLPFVGESLDATQGEFDKGRYGRGVGRSLALGTQAASMSPTARATTVGKATEVADELGSNIVSVASKTGRALEEPTAKSLRIAADLVHPRRALQKVERKLAKRIETRHKAREKAQSIMDETEGIDEKVAKFEADAKANPPTLDNKGGGGSNYTQADLDALKKKHNIGQPIGEVSPASSKLTKALDNKSEPFKYKPGSKHFVRSGNIIRDYEIDSQGNPKLVMERHADTNEPLPFTEEKSTKLKRKTDKVEPTVPQLGPFGGGKLKPRPRAEVVDDQSVLDTMRSDLSTQSNRAVSAAFDEAGKVGGHPAREGLAEGVTGKQAGFGAKKLKKKANKESTSAEGPKRPGTGPGAMLAKGSRLLRMNEGPQTGDTTRTAFDMLHRSGPFAQGEVHIALNNPEMFAPIDRKQLIKTRLPLDSTRWVRTQNWIRSNKQVREVMENGAIPGKGAHGDWHDTPIYIVKRDNQHFILNGHHRITAAIKRGDADIEVELIDITGPKEKGYRNLAKDLLRKTDKTHKFEMKSSSNDSVLGSDLTTRRKFNK